MVKHLKRKSETRYEQNKRRPPLLEDVEDLRCFEDLTEELSVGLMASLQNPNPGYLNVILKQSGNSRRTETPFSVG